MYWRRWRLKAQRFLLIVTLVCLVISLASTLATYRIYYSDPHIVDAAFVYRGWPLHWIVESWSWWSPYKYPHAFHLQPVNLLIDIVFWAVVFQIPSATLLLLKESRKDKHSESSSIGAAAGIWTRDCRLGRLTPCSCLCPNQTRPRPHLTGTIHLSK
mgnify:CR=1 FL=1